MPILQIEDLKSTHIFMISHTTNHVTYLICGNHTMGKSRSLPLQRHGRLFQEQNSQVHRTSGETFWCFELVQGGWTWTNGGGCYGEREWRERGKVLHLIGGGGVGYCGGETTHRCTEFVDNVQRVMLQNTRHLE